MERQMINRMSFLFFSLFLLLSYFNVSHAKSPSSSSQANTFTPRASLIRYWNNHISNNLPKPLFLFSKASPLNAQNSAIFTNLATQNSLSSHFHSFCSLANLYCSFEDDHPLTQVSHKSDKKYNNAGELRSTSMFSDLDLDALRINWGVITIPKKLRNGYNSGSSVNRSVEPGIFFRESMLKEGNVMVMPDIEDGMPKRSFLPQAILSKLPFSTLRLSKLKGIFHASENSSMERVLVKALAECEMAPHLGESKQCVGSVEDMIDFAVSVLGHNVVVRSTKNVNGSKQNVMIGSVKEINGGEATNLVSCHQRMYPYLLYYCHSVPKVRVYQADILDVESKAKINHGVAICHLNTTEWSPKFAAFLALGFSPGQIEICHWFYENEMVWTTAD